MRFIFEEGKTTTSLIIWIWSVTIFIVNIQGVVTLFGYPIPPLWATVIGLSIALWLVLLEIFNRRKPLITVNVDNNQITDVFGLRVRNDGPSDIFQAQIKLLEPFDDIPNITENTYLGYWNIHNEGEAKLQSGHEDLLKIAKKISYPPHYNILHLDVFYFDAGSNNCACWQTSSHYIGSSILHPDGTREICKPPEYVIDVVISSKRAIKDGVFRKQYKLTFNGLVEVDIDKSQPKECTISRSTFHRLLKKVSQPVKKARKSGREKS